MIGYGLVLALHVLVSFLLIGVILVQGGRGGMAETMGGPAAQSLFGGGANVVMTKVTAVGAALFMVTCLSLAVLSSHRGRSVIERMPMTMPETAPIPMPGAPPAPSSANPGLPQPATARPGSDERRAGEPGAPAASFGEAKRAGVGDGSAAGGGSPRPAAPTPSEPVKPQ